MKLALLSLLAVVAAHLSGAETNSPPINLVQPPNLVPATVLTWDADATQGMKHYDARIGETSAYFTFWVTNISPAAVSITSVSSSCGCTVAQLPSQPWVLKPGANGPIKVTVDLRGRYGTVMKGITVNSTAGVKALVVRANVPQPAGANPGFAVPSDVTAERERSSGSSTMSRERARNLQLALGDRQSVLRGECARCHVEPARSKTGRELYTTLCGICHDASPRAAMVPNLREPKEPRTLESWKQVIAQGRPGSLMPAFAQAEGGPLTDLQIAALAEYLSKHGLEQPAAGQPAATAGGTDPRKKW